jgi:acyl-coenzyme A synthetase/AMP-(fatty) acid ligase
VSARRLLVTSTHLATLVAEVKALFHSSCTENGVNELLVEELPTFADVYPHLAGKHAEKFSRRCLGTRYEDPHEDRHEEVEELLLRQPHTYSGNVEMYLHSSGSTGLPKPIAYTHAVLESHAHFSK